MDWTAAAHALAAHLARDKDMRLDDLRNIAEQVAQARGKATVLPGHVRDAVAELTIEQKSDPKRRTTSA